MAEPQEADVDSIIDRLLDVRGSRPGKQVQLQEYEIRYLCTKAREIFIQQPILLELEAPIKVSKKWHHEFQGHRFPLDHKFTLPSIFYFIRAFQSICCI